MLPALAVPSPVRNESSPDTPVDAVPVDTDTAPLETELAVSREIPPLTPVPALLEPERTRTAPPSAEVLAPLLKRSGLPTPDPPAPTATDKMPAVCLASPGRNRQGSRVDT